MNLTDNHPRNKQTNAPSAARFAISTLSACLVLAFSAPGHALPTGGVVAAGAAGIVNSTSATTITQTSANAVINWQSFGVGAGQTVQFVQPGSSSVALNRVLGNDPSSILGNLSANGKVFLLNPNGVLFGSGASVNVGGLVASTMSITDANFMAGRYAFTDAGNGSVVNQGNINAADGGYVALMGKSVSNQGVISARMGTVALAAGNAITMDIGGDGLLNLSISQGAVNALIENGGMIRADGGRVLLTAQAAGNLLNTVVNNTGVIQAQTIGTSNGSIFLLGDMQSGTVSIGGTVDASGTGAGQTGGNVTATGHHVGLFSGQINASGDAGGGTVLVGGGYQGNNPAVQNASATYMSADSTINVDALTNGKGGTAVLWANDTTRAHGVITARGGAQGGDGGLIETSAHWLDVQGARVNASAPNGKAGMWLLDPTDVTISLTGGGAGQNGTFAGGVFTPAAGAQTSNISSTQLSAALTGATGTDITITTTSTGNGFGDITVQDPITWVRTGLTPTTLTLLAARDVNVNAAITATNGNLVVCCGRDINVNAAITTTGTVATPNQGGNVLLSAGRDVNIVRAANTGALPNKSLTDITTTSGNMEICAGRDIVLGNTFDLGRLLTLNNSVANSNGPFNPVTQRGMTLRAGNAATGPGVAGGGGTLKIDPGTIIKVTGPAGISPINIFYNPTSYAATTDYSGFFATGDGSPFTQFMLVFPEVQTKFFDGTTAATLTGLQGTPAGVTLNPGGVFSFDSAAVGNNVPVTFSGLSLTQAPIVAGGTARNFALQAPCCGVGGQTVTRTTGTIRPVGVAGFIPGVSALPYVAITAPAFATFASYLPGLVPTYASDASDVFFTIKEEEVAPPTVIPFISPPPPYLAPRYVPKPARN